MVLPAPLRCTFSRTVLHPPRSNFGFSPLALPCRQLATTPTPTPPFYLRTTTPDISSPKTAKAYRKSLDIAGSEDGILWNGVVGSGGRWEVVCGLEIHAQLNTERKLFSDAKTSFNEPPNTHVAVFDAALPGSQPVFQETTLFPALRAAIALNCNIMRESRFDRKHYFYWDQPGGYQITQFYLDLCCTGLPTVQTWAWNGNWREAVDPLAKDGYIKLLPTDGIELGEGVGELVVGIRQVQLEQDTAKTITTPSIDPTKPAIHLIDLNRVSHPLIEVITTPCLPSAAHASLALRKLQSLLRATGAVTLGMEWGGLRCDVNVSVRLRGSPLLGQRCEIKNLSSVKLVEEAVNAEARRQVQVLESGGAVTAETRGWDVEKGETYRLRGKEGEVDYRYMPEPDLPPIRIAKGVVEWLLQTMPELPDEMMARLSKPVKDGGAYGLTVKDAHTLMGWDSGARVPYFEEIVGKVRDLLAKEGERGDMVIDAGRVVGNWVIHELAANLSSANLEWHQNPVSPQHLADIVAYLFLGNITGPTSKLVLSSLIMLPPTQALSLSIPDYIAENNLLLVPLSPEDLRRLVADTVASAPDMVGQYCSVREQWLKELQGGTGKKLKGLEKKLGGLKNWFVGRVVKAGEGKVDARRVEGVVGEVLDGGEVEGQGSRTGGEKE